MKTPICPRCGCSLVRLGVSKDKAATYSYKGEEYLFCCQQCADMFMTDPEQHEHGNPSNPTFPSWSRPRRASL